MEFSYTLGILLIVCFCFFCLICSAVLEERKSSRQDDISPTLLRVRIDIFLRRIQELEEEKSALARQVAQREFHHDLPFHLHVMLLEIDAQIHQKTRQVEQMREELRRIDPEGEAQIKEDLEMHRVHVIDHELYFQVLEDTKQEEKQPEEKKADDSNPEDADIETADKKDGRTSEDSNCTIPVENDVESPPQHPERVFKKWFNGVPKEECSICLDGYSIGDTVAWSRSESCPHLFHADCLAHWLQKHDQCPMCRSPLIHDEPADT